MSVKTLVNKRSNIKIPGYKDLVTRECRKLKIDEGHFELALKTRETLMVHRSQHLSWFGSPN